MNHLGDIPRELILKLITYVDDTNFYNISIINKYFNKMKLERCIYQNRIIINFGDKEDMLSDWYLDYLKSVSLKQYLDDIYYSIFLESLEPQKKSIFRKIIIIKNKFNYRAFRNILYYNQFDKYNNINTNTKKIRFHTVYRIDLISYFKLKRNHMNILALIY